MKLTDREKKTLLSIARKTIEKKLTGKGALPAVESELLNEKRGAFVTLKKKGALRGCIGYIEPVRALHRTIEEMALAAAFDDPRFPPLCAEELCDLELEISVLTPLVEIKDVSQIEVGKHGIYLRKGYCAGLLLPQVAKEYRWDRLTFLEQTCYKAGLPRGAWKEKDARIFIFSADVFCEADRS
ncbi:MAG: AmmeMemoRadiSam system protein A [Smithellaceae bacterium]|nr:AmmeMemoRadiSam system protein A [Smithellaceae bacterium]